jgi:hypothetical protein
LHRIGPHIISIPATLSGLIPGQTHLNSKEAEQIGMIPTGVELFAFEAALFGFLSFEQIQGDVPRVAPGTILAVVS